MSTAPPATDSDRSSTPSRTDIQSTKPVVRSWLLTAFFLLACTAFVYRRMFPLFGVPYLHVGDYEYWVLDGMRMLDGQVMYRDFQEITFPGLQFTYFVLFKWFGVRAWIPAAVVVALASGYAWVGLLIARRIFPGPRAYVPVILFLAFGYTETLDPTHHLFSGLAAAAALAVVMYGESRVRVMGAGALCALAAFFTQTRGLIAVIGIAAVLIVHAGRGRIGLRDSALQAAVLVVSFAGVLGVLCLPFITPVGLARFLESTVLFYRHYAQYFYNTFAAYGASPPPWAWRRLPLLCVWVFMHVLVPGIYLLVLVVLQRIPPERRENVHDRLRVLAVFGLVLFLAVAKSPNPGRFAPDSLPAFVLLAWYLESRGHAARTLLRVMLVVAVLYAIALDWPRRTTWLDLPVGRVGMYRDEAGAGAYLWMSEHMHPGDYMLEARNSDLYFWLRLRSPTTVPFFTTSEITRPEQVSETIANLERFHVRYIVWDQELEFDPSMAGGDHLQPLRDYMRDHYRKVRTLPHDVDVWERATDEGDSPSLPATL